MAKNQPILDGYANSVFVVEIPDGASTILYHTLNNTFVYLHDPIDKILQTRTLALSYLLRNDYLVESSITTEEQYQQVLKKLRRPRGHLNILFTPNTTCNLACAYCFENRVKRTVMSDENVDNTLKWMSHRIQERDIKMLSVNLFGGEPMLEVDKLFRYMSGVNNICKLHSVNLRSAQLTTNGLDNNEANLAKLAELGINEVQITVDGTRTVNDARRKIRHNDGSPTPSVYDKVIANLPAYARHFEVTVKINFDKTTLHTIEAVLDDISNVRNSVKGKVLVKPEPIATWRPTNSSIDSTLFERGSIEMAKAFCKVVDAIDARSIDLDMSAIFPTPCMVMSEDSFLIEPDGSLRSCISAFGMNEFDASSVYSFNEQANSREKYRITNESLHNNLCVERNCPYLPVCDGGCRYESVLSGLSLDSMFCGYDYYKEMVPYLVKRARSSKANSVSLSALQLL